MAFFTVRHYYALECTVEAENETEAKEKGDNLLDTIGVDCSEGAIINYADCMDTEVYSEGD